MGNKSKKQKNNGGSGIKDENQRKVLGSCVRGGYRIMLSFPQIADYYRNDYTRPQIVSLMESELSSVVGTNDHEILETAVYRALRGNDNPYFGPVYSGLMGEEEQKRIAQENLYNNRCNNGHKCHVLGSGIHSRSSGEHSEAGKKGVTAQGNTPYTEEELGVLRELVSSEEYRTNKGGCLWKKLTRHHNLIMEKERSKNSLVDVVRRKDLMKVTA